MSSDRSRISLELSDGAVFEGTPFGARCEAAGEVVFNTGMTGYTETLTDPSYRGQILAMTYPLVGNYGVPNEDWESRRVQVEALVIGHQALHPSHVRMRRTLDGWLREQGIPAIAGVDTRALTRRLRSTGTIAGRLVDEAASARRREPVDMERVAELVTEPGIRRYDGGRRRVLLIDTGAKESIVRCLQARGLGVVRAAFFEAWESLLGEVDAVVLPNGPGDPSSLGALVERIRPLLDGRMPILGICLGHQLVALAAGARTYKLPFGHRSQNQPVIDVETRRAYVTSQNHGYAVAEDSIPRGFVEAYRNLNDGTNEGLRHQSRPILTVQFHPEAAAGPHDTEHVFDRFAGLLTESAA